MNTWDCLMEMELPFWMLHSECNLLWLWSIFIGLFASFTGANIAVVCLSGCIRIFFIFIWAHILKMVNDIQSVTRVSNSGSTYLTCNLLFIGYHPITVHHKTKISPCFILTFKSRCGEGTLCIHFSLSVVFILVHVNSHVSWHKVLIIIVLYHGI